MKRHLTNAAYGALDYAAYPIGMLLVAPIVLHKLGAEEYGIWTIATGVISIGGVIASGFCDANLQRVAKLRATQERDAMVHTVRSILSINLVLGMVLAIAAWMAAPYGAVRIASTHLQKMHECTVTLRIASVLILLRAVETVSVSTQRAFEEFGATIRISTAVRLLTLAAAAALAAAGHRTVSILAATGVVMFAGVLLQFRQLFRLLGPVPLWPTFERQGTRALLRFGAFTWIQAVGSVFFGQLDRVMLGVALGAAAVAPYSLCVQFAHPIYGLTASALSFLFPYLSGRVSTASREDLRRSLWKAFGCNALLVSAGSLMLLVLGPHILRAWTSPSVTHAAQGILPWVVLGSALMGMSVTAVYALLAMGVFRAVAVLNLTARAVTLALMWIAIRHAGLGGLAITRAGYGIFSLLLYWPMWRALRARVEPQSAGSSATDVASRELRVEGAMS